MTKESRRFVEVGTLVSVISRVRDTILSERPMVGGTDDYYFSGLRVDVDGLLYLDFVYFRSGFPCPNTMNDTLDLSLLSSSLLSSGALFLSRPVVGGELDKGFVTILFVRKLVTCGSFGMCRSKGGRFIQNFGIT